MSPYSPNKGVPSPFRETCAHPSFQARRECHDVTHVVLGASQAAGSDWAIADFFQLFNLRTFCFAHRGRFACFGRFVWLVSVVSFRCFGFSLRLFRCFVPRAFVTFVDGQRRRLWERDWTTAFVQAICPSRIRKMSKHLFAKAVQDAASGSEDGPNSFRGKLKCHEFFFQRIKLKLYPWRY